MGYLMMQSNDSVSMMMTPQHVKQTMMNDPESMIQWMTSPQHVKQMIEIMSKNHDFVQQMIMEMINDPNIRLQMLGHMSENPEMMQDIMMMNGNMTGMHNMTNMMNHP